MSKEKLSTGSSGAEVEEQSRRPAVLELELQREVYTGKSTIGRLLVNGEFECFTLEDCARPEGEKVPGATCIPAGAYRLIINYSARFRRLLPLLLDVPGFEGIRIHAGNTATDTEGCILVGETRAENLVGRSRAAFRRLFAKLQSATAAGAPMRVTVIDTRLSEAIRPEMATLVPELPDKAKIDDVHVERWNPERDGQFSEEALRRKLEKMGYSVARYTYAPGTFFPPHTHAQDKVDAVVAGRFRIRMGGSEAVLEAGDAVRVPRGAEHSAEVVGTQAVVSLDAVKAG